MCVTNLSSDPLPLPPHRAVLLASADVSDGHLPSDATAWLRPARPIGRGPSVEGADGGVRTRDAHRDRGDADGAGRTNDTDGPSWVWQERRARDEVQDPAPDDPIAAIVVAVTTLLAACGPAPRQSAPSAAPSVAPPARRQRLAGGRSKSRSPSWSAPCGPGVTQAAVDALYEQIGQFEDKYPWITVEPEEYNWTAPTFTAALAAGTLPDVFTIPFTDGKGLIAAEQIVDIDALVRALGYGDKFNPNVLVNGQDADGKIFAVPTAAYGMSLTYNRTPVHAGRAGPGCAPHDLGGGPGGGQDHRREDRHGRLRLDGHREHRWLAADDVDVRQWWTDAGGRRGRQGHGDRQQRRRPRPSSSASRRCAGTTRRWAPRSTTRGAR